LGGGEPKPPKVVGARQKGQNLHGKKGKGYYSGGGGPKKRGRKKKRYGALRGGNMSQRPFLRGKFLEERGHLPLLLKVQRLGGENFCRRTWKSLKA